MEISKLLKGIKKISSDIGYSAGENINIDLLINDATSNYLTINTARNGRDVLWYLYNDSNYGIYLDTLEYLTEEEIENELY